MAHRPDRPSYLESLDEGRRATLLDMASLCRQDRNRLQSAQHSVRRSHSNEKPLKTARPLDSTSLYMKSIWQLRHQLNAVTIDHESAKQQLIDSEKRCRALESELQNARYQYNAYMSTIAEQFEELISRSDLATRAANLAVERQKRSDNQRTETECSLSTLRSLLASDLARSENVESAKNTRRHVQLLEKLITPEIIEDSQPPEDFIVSTLRPFTTQEFRLMEEGLKQANIERRQLRDQLDALHSKYEKSQSENHKKLKMWEEQKAKLNQSLTGAARRIQWLVGEKQKMLKDFTSLNDYSIKLEKKLLKQYEELQKLKSSKAHSQKSKAKSNNVNSSHDADREKKSEKRKLSLDKVVAANPEQKAQTTLEQSSDDKVEPSEPIKTEQSGILHLVQNKEHQRQVDDNDSMFGNTPMRIQFGLDHTSDSFDDRPSLTALVKKAVEDSDS